MRLLVPLAVFFFLLCSGVSQSEGLSQKETKIAVFNLQTVIGKSDAFEAAKKLMATTFEEKKKEIDQKRRELEKLGGAMSKSSTKEQQEKFREQQKEYTDMANTYVRNVQMAEQQSHETMNKLVMAAAKDLAEVKHYDLILDANAALYFSSQMDVTAEMLETVNRLWKDDQKE